MKDNTNKISHLNMIQEVIGRFSRNSFTIKSWNITLLTGFLAYSLSTGIKEENILVITIAFSLGFMFLDWYYLNLEKSYRNLYKSVSNLEDDNNVDFRMEFHKPKDIPTKYDVEKVSFFYGILRPIVFVFYFAEIVFLLVFLLS